MDFCNLFIFEMANNHQGSVSHGKAIIRSVSDIAKKRGIAAAIKFQYRDVDTLINAEYRSPSTDRHIARFISTRIQPSGYEEMIHFAKSLGLFVGVTPFDETSAELCARQIEGLPEDLVIDQVNWWEDMASKNGPLVSPALFREFLQPGYRRVMAEAKRRGCALGMVDCDGNPHDIVANWLEEGVNIMFPLEVSAGVDPYAWREEFGAELRLRGGIAKRPLVEGGQAIDKELEAKDDAQ